MDGGCVCRCSSTHLELCADILRHESNGGFLDDLEVPRAEDLHGQDAVRLVDAEALAKRLGHAVGTEGPRRRHDGHHEPGWGGVAAKGPYLYTKVMHVMKKAPWMVKK